MSDIAGLSSSRQAAATPFSHQPQYNPSQQMNMPTSMPMPVLPQRPPPPPIQTKGENAPPPPRRPGDLTNTRPDILMGRGNMSQTIQQSLRPEMKGPSDITDILSGLKTKTINIQEPPPQQQSQSHSQMQNLNDSSTISITDLKDLQGDGNMPKKSKRRQKSASNTVSLDI